jgi:dihydrofolate reductase
MMSVYFYGCMTLDGYLADKNHSLDWLHQSGSAEETSYDDFYKKMDVTIMGRKTFSEVLKMGDPKEFYPTTKNYVFTHDKSLSNEGFNFIEGDVVEFVKNIDKNKHVWIVGGNTLLAPLLDHDLIDIMIVQIAPVLLGDGIPLFTQKEAVKRFELKEAKKYGQFTEMVYIKK